MFSCSKTTGIHTTEEQKRLAGVHSQVAFDFMFNGNTSVALGEAEEALRLDPRGIAANHAMARVQQLLNNHPLVVHFYQQALKTDPYAVLVLNDYGQYLCHQGKPEDALALFERAGSQLMDSHRMVSYTRAAACATLYGDHDVAQRHLRRALQLNPDSKPVLLNLIRANIGNADYTRARENLDRYLRLGDKSNPEVLKLAQQIQANS